MVNNFRYGLTRQSFSSQGDSSAPSISFRFVYSPVNFSRTLSRVSPTHNFTDDFTWVKGKHTFQFGGNVRIIRNKRLDFGSAFDSAVTNPSWYEDSGDVINQAFEAAGYTIDSGSSDTLQAAATALIGRLSQYTGNFTFDIDGSVLPSGTPTIRNFATEEYETYFQDIWKPRRNLTLTLGLRYSVGTPVYEKNGFEVVPKEPLGDYFQRRIESAAKGVPLNDLIIFQKGGPANDAPGFYKTDWNNFQPRLAAAWSPNFKKGFLKTLFGADNESVIRGGFAITNDHFGEQLAVSFDGLSPIGFTSSTTISTNAYNVTDTLAPRFTGFNMNIRSFPGIPAPTQRFTATPTPECLSGEEECPQPIEVSLDGTIKTPIHYTWNVSYGRKLPWGMYFEASYIGHKARNLLAARDVLQLNNIVDPKSGMDWYTAAGKLVDLRGANTAVSSVQPIPYFENIFPNFGENFWGDSSLSSTQGIYLLAAKGAQGGFNIIDWTTVQLIIDDYGTVPNLFFHPQYGALSTFSSVARSDYNAAVFSLRQRLGETLTYDINYTWSKSFDNASGLQTGGSYGSQFILNALRPMDNYAVSDFDTRHSLNANFIFQLPIGKGKKWFSDMNSWTDFALGGWQLAGIFRANSGLPTSVPFDGALWATNWNAQSSGVRTAPLQISVNRDTQSAFSDPAAALHALRNARPGETGDRNALRLPGYSTFDVGLSKSLTMPWSENHKLQLRWEVINAFNLQYFNADNFTRSNFGLPKDPALKNPSADFGKIFSSIQGNPRRMQFGLRYSF
jgi:hypothetical protein